MTVLTAPVAVHAVMPALARNAGPEVTSFDELTSQVRVRPRPVDLTRYESGIEGAARAGLGTGP